MKAKAIFIPGNTPSSKNSKRIVYKEKVTGEKYPLIINSKTVEKYKKVTKINWLEQKAVFRHLSKDSPLPLVVGIHFVRGTKHKFDWINMLQIIQDLMVEYDWIEDDNSDNLMPIPFKMKGNYYTYDKERAGTWIVPITQTVLDDLKGNLDD